MKQNLKEKTISKKSWARKFGKYGFIEVLGEKSKRLALIYDGKAIHEDDVWRVEKFQVQALRANEPTS